MPLNYPYMLTIDIPNSRPLQLEHLVLDYNGTLAVDGELLHGVRQRLAKLKRFLKIQVITADTHGTVRQKLLTSQLTPQIIGATNQDVAKQEFVAGLGGEKVVAMGNGRNDVLMLEAAALGIGLLQKEGAAAAVLRSADVVCTSIQDALDLLIYPDRLRATLRN